MPSTRDIRRRIKSVKNTAQITKAMQMVAASKMRKAQQAALAGRPYARLMNKVLAEVASETREITHPFLEKREGTRRCVILVSTDKGLCGGLNSNLMREAAKFDNGAAVHRRRAQRLPIPGPHPAARWSPNSPSRTRRFSAKPAPFPNSPPTFSSRARWTAWTSFSRISSPPWCKSPKSRQLLPISEVGPVQAGMGAEQGRHRLPGQTGEFLFEPSQEHVLAALLPHSLNFQIYQILLEAKASEHSARMVAMKNATDNAQQFIKDLTLEYNKLRQANITKELLEIASAAMAMN